MKLLRTVNALPPFVDKIALALSIIVDVSSSLAFCRAEITLKVLSKSSFVLLSKESSPFLYRRRLPRPFMFIFTSLVFFLLFSIKRAKKSVRYCLA